LTEPGQPAWRKSSFSGGGDCLEWLACADGVRLRNSTTPDGVELHLTHAEWTAFIAGVKAGEADTPRESR
jgi:Domain of unknown function (DUF397)